MENTVMTRKIEVSKLNFDIYSKEILKQVSIKVKQGQIVGIIGPNGSGKTTLLKHIYRVIPVKNKTVFINGSDLNSYSYRESAKAITVMRQENSSNFDYTVLQIVLMGRSPYKRVFENNSEEDINISIHALEKVGMNEYVDRVFSTLSGGEKQRVLIARSLAQQTDILVLDEPTNHLDIYYQWALMDTISKLGKTIVSVFHELNLACRYCGYLYVLKDGEVVLHGKPTEICTSEMLKDIFRVSADVVLGDKEVPHIIYKNAIV